MSTFGVSAPAKVCFEKFGITAENVVKTAKKTLDG
jgi:transketolase